MATPTAFQKFWVVAIHTYTRAQALADGALVDVTEIGREAGFRLSVAMTAGAWSEVVASPDCDPLCLTPVGQDERDRLWDVLMQARIAARRAHDESVVALNVLRVPGSCATAKPTRLALKMVIGPGDDGEPVITILLPGED